MTVRASCARWGNRFFENVDFRVLMALLVDSDTLMVGKLLLIPVLLWWLLNREVRVSVHEGLEAGISLGVWDLPGKPPKDHAQEDDGDTPNISLPRIIRFLVEDFWGKVGIATDDPRRWCMRLARIVENGGSAKVNKLDDVIRRHDAVIELEITVGKTHLMQVFDPIADLTEDTVDFRTTHLS
jgi:hypothetical protein